MHIATNIARQTYGFLGLSVACASLSSIVSTGIGGVVLNTVGFLFITSGLDSILYTNAPSYALRNYLPVQSDLSLSDSLKVLSVGSVIVYTSVYLPVVSRAIGTVLLLSMSYWCGMADWVRWRGTLTDGAMHWGNYVLQNDRMTYTKS